jgi:hypothetical protein
MQNTLDFTETANGAMTLPDTRTIVLTDGAYPTSSVQREGGEEWACSATLAGEEVTVYFQFSDEEIIAASAINDNPCEEFPWGIEHMTRIEDEDGGSIQF